MSDVNNPVSENHPGSPDSAPAQRSRPARLRDAFGTRLMPLAVFVVAWMLLSAGFRAGLLIASRVHGERITRRAMAGALVAVAGVVVLFLR